MERAAARTVSTWTEVKVLPSPDLRSSAPQEDFWKTARPVRCNIDYDGSMFMHRFLVGEGGAWEGRGYVHEIEIPGERASGETHRRHAAARLLALSRAQGRTRLHCAHAPATKFRARVNQFVSSAG